LIDDIRGRLGDDRRQSVEELKRQMQLLDKLEQTATREANEAAKKLLAKEADHWLRDVRRGLQVSMRDLREARDALEREGSAEQAHNDRVGLDSESGSDRTLVTKIGRTLLKVLALHFVPGLGPALVDFGEAALRLIGVVGDPSKIEGINFSLPVPILGNLLNLNIGTDLLDSHSQRGDRPLTLSADLDIGFNLPGIAVVEESPDSQVGYQDPPGDQAEETPIMESGPAPLRDSRAASEASDAGNEEGTRQRGEIVVGLQSADTRQDQDDASGDEAQAGYPEGYSAERAAPHTIRAHSHRHEARPPADADEAIAPESPAVLEESDETQLTADQELGSAPGRDEIQTEAKHAGGPLPRQLMTFPDSGDDESEKADVQKVNRASAKYAGPERHASADDRDGLLSADLRADNSSAACWPAADLAAGATGVVICCAASQLLAVAHTSPLDSSLILSLARQIIVRKLFDGAPGSLKRAISAAKNLEVVMFVDPELRVAVWVDVNPASQLPAAILVVSADGQHGQPHIRSLPAPRAQP
jgi:hypothetical protein